jgi:hypothetical protein
VSYDELVKFVSQVGFPIVVAGYLLFRLERTSRALEAKIDRLIALVERVLERKP